MDAIESPLILTLRLDTASFTELDALRRRHFPAARNLLPAHLTLFHLLPGEGLEVIAAHLTATAAATRKFPLNFPTVRFLGRGVAVEVASADLLQVRGALAAHWDAWLGRQDRQPFKPHVTVQNKADPADARALYARLRADWRPMRGQALGLSLWWYRGGPWEPAKSFDFTA